MGQNTMDFPQASTTVTIGWNDNNLRIGNIVWDISAPKTLHVRIYRLNISPDPVYDQIHVGPQIGESNVPGNLRMQEITDPEYPEEGTRIIYPDGLVFNIGVIE